MAAAMTDDIPSKKKCSWSASEEATLIQAVHSNEDVLFGSMSGSGGVKLTAQKKRKWEEITEILHSQFQNSRREPKEVKKKYFNTKQRAKSKLDSSRRPGTGGGPPPEAPSSAEEIIIAATGTRPGMMGISNGVDSDALLLQPLLPEIGEEGECQAVLPSIPTSTICNNEATSTMLPCSRMPITCSKANEPTSRKQKTSLQALTETNIILDNKRLQLEIERVQQDTKKIILEQAKLEQEKALMGVKSAYWTLKLQSEFTFA